MLQYRWLWTMGEPVVQAKGERKKDKTLLRERQDLAKMPSIGDCQGPA
jgi:hypothetical protein